MLKLALLLLTLAAIVKQALLINTDYPISGAFFKDRYSLAEWDATFAKFSSMNGDTAVVRAPSLTPRPADEIRHDPLFKHCQVGNINSTLPVTDCITHAQQDMEQLGYRIKSYATYTYEENYSNHLIKCLDLDVMVNNSGMVYYRLVFPLNQSFESCEIQKSSDVLVVLTAFSGIDPHELMLKSAVQNNITVFFGLPGVPKGNYSVYYSDDLIHDLLTPYYYFVERVLHEHSYRYKFKPKEQKLRFKPVMPSAHSPLTVFQMSQKKAANKFSLKSDAIAGYFGNDEVCLGNLPYLTGYQQLYNKVGAIVNSFNKKFMLSPFVNLNKLTTNYSLTDHVSGFKLLAETKMVNIIAVQEARGRAKGSYYFEPQANESIAKVDPDLLKVLQHNYPNVSSDVTFSELYLGSNNQLFKLLSDSYNSYHTSKNPVELWVNIDAYEATNDNPCLPTDPSDSGMPEALDRTTKQRLDLSLSGTGTAVSKAITFSWDPDFTCKPQGYDTSLADDVINDAQRTILMYCGWHSRENMSIVIIGHSVLGDITSSYQVIYQLREGNTLNATQFPYYVEGDWGDEHHRLPSLVYTQFWDLPDPFDLSMNGTVTVRSNGGQSSSGGFHKCMFTYDFR